jgi:hypothetical protein
VNLLDLKFFRNHRFELSGLGLIISGIFLFIGTAGWLFPDADMVKDSEYLQGILEPIGNYDFWVFVPSVIAFAILLWLFYDFIVKVKKFNNLIETPSKSNFRKNKDEMEFLAWELGNKFVERFEERKKELRIRD